MNYSTAPHCVILLDSFLVPATPVQKEASHFVTICCYHRSVAQGMLRLLTTDASRRIFESALERVRRSFRLQVYGYVVMPGHVHLLLSEPQWDRPVVELPHSSQKTA